MTRDRDDGGRLLEACKELLRSRLAITRDVSMLDGTGKLRTEQETGWFVAHATLAEVGAVVTRLTAEDSDD